MILPEVNISQGEPLVPLYKDPNAGIKAGLQVLGGIGGAAAVIKDGMDEAAMMKQNAITAQSFKDIDDYISSGDRVDINDPRMPNEVRTQIMKDIDRNDPEITVEGDKTFVPTRRVIKPVIDHYQAQLTASADKVPISRRQEYETVNQNAYDKLAEKAGKIERGYILEDMQKSYLASVSQQVQAGDMDGAFDTVSKARNSGIFSDENVVAVTKNIVSTFTNRFETQLDDYTDDLGAAAYKGNGAEIKLAQKNINDHVMEAVDLGLITPEQANEHIAKADSDAEKLRFRGDITRLYDSEGIQAATNALRVHENKKPEGVSQEDWLKTVDAARADVNKRYADESKIKADMKDISKKDARIAAAMQLVNLGMPAVGTDAEAGMDDAYESTLQYAWANPATQYQWAEASYKMVEKTGYMPKGLKDDLVRMVNSGEANPAAAALAGDVYSRIQQLPNAIDDISSMKDDVLLSEVAANSRAGLSPQQSYDIAAKTVAVDPMTRKTRDEAWALAAGDYKKTMKRINSASNAIYDRWFKDDPKLAEAYTVQYRDLERSMFLLTGDMQKAGKYAADKLNKVWRVTEINGERQLMQFAPESVYGQINGKSDWIKNDFEQYKQRQLPDLVEKYGAENIIIQSDYYTTHTPQVSYAVVVRDANNIGTVFNATDSNNLRRRWYPDIEQNADYKLNKKVAADQLAEQRQDMSYQRTVFDRAMAKFAGIDSIAEGDNPDPQGQYAHIREKSIPLLAEAMDEAMHDEGLVNKEAPKHRGDLYNRKASKEAEAAVQEAYNRKMNEVMKRLQSRHEQKVKEYKARQAVKPNRSNPAPSNYVPEL